MLGLSFQNFRMASSAHLEFTSYRPYLHSRRNQAHLFRHYYTMGFAAHSKDLPGSCARDQAKFVYSIRHIRVSNAVFAISIWRTVHELLAKTPSASACG